jgi:hypothetical protein
LESLRVENRLVFLSSPLQEEERLVSWPPEALEQRFAEVKKVCWHPLRQVGE